MAHFHKTHLYLLICICGLFCNPGLAREWRVETYTVGEPIEYSYDDLDDMSDDSSQTHFYDLPDFLSVDTDSLNIIGTATEGGCYTFRIEIFEDDEFISFDCTIYVADSIWSEPIEAEGTAGVFVESETTLLSIGWEGDVLRTTDGMTWSAAPSVPGMISVNGAAYIDGTFVVMGAAGELAYSTDNGENWALADRPNQAIFVDLYRLQRLQVLNNEFVVISPVLNSETSLVLRSTDGINWSSQTIDLGRVTACGYMGGNYYINTYPGGISISDDFETWTSVALEGTEYAHAFGQLPDGELLIIGYNDQVWKSADATSWQLAQTLSDWGDNIIETPQGLYLSSWGTLQYTENGTDWSLLEVSDYGWQHFFHSQRLGLFFASDYEGIRSTDGTWLPQITVPEPYTYTTEYLLVGDYVEYQIETNTPVTRYYAFNLPDGFDFNEATGLISGTPTQSDNYYDILIGAENATGFSSATSFDLRIRDAEGDPASYKQFSAFEIDAELPLSKWIPLEGTSGSISSQLNGFPESVEISGPQLRGNLDAGIYAGSLTIDNQYGTAVLPLKLVSSVRDWRSIGSVWVDDQTSINYGDGRFYATTRNWTIFSSEDGMHWEEIAPSFYLPPIDDVTGLDGFTYAISYFGSIYRSQTRSDWELVQDGWYFGMNSTPNWIRNVNDRLFASDLRNSEVRTASTLRTSNDGVNWTDLAFEVEDYFTDIAYESGRYVLVGQEHVFTSVDGINWELLYDTAPEESLRHFNDSSSVCATNGGLIISMGYNNEAFYLDASDPELELELELQAITHEGFDIHAPWAVVRRGDALYAQDTLGNELQSTDGITWTILTESSTPGWGSGDKNQVFAAEGVELWNNPSMEYVQVYQATHLPQLTTDGIIAAHVHDSISHPLDLSLNTTVDLIEGLPNGLTYDADQNQITGTLTSSGYFGATVQLSNAHGENYFLLRFEVLPSLPTVTVVDSIVATDEYGDAYFALSIESDSDYEIKWKKVSATYYSGYYETVHEAPYDIARLQYLSSSSAGAWHAEVTNAGGTVYSDPVELVIRRPYTEWDDDQLGGKTDKEPDWQQTNLERYALGLNTESDKVHLPKLQSEGAAHCFEFSLSQLAQDLELGVQYSTDLVEWKGEDEITIEQVSEDFERIHYKAYLNTPRDCAFYRLFIRDTTGSSSGSGSSGSSSTSGSSYATSVLSSDSATESLSSQTPRLREAWIRAYAIPVE